MEIEINAIKKWTVPLAKILIVGSEKRWNTRIWRIISEIILKIIIMGGTEKRRYIIDEKIETERM